MKGPKPQILILQMLVNHFASQMVYPKHEANGSKATSTLWGLRDTHSCSSNTSSSTFGLGVEHKIEDNQPFLL